MKAEAADDRHMPKYTAVSTVNALAAATTSALGTAVIVTQGQSGQAAAVGSIAAHFSSAGHTDRPMLLRMLASGAGIESAVERAANSAIHPSGVGK